MANISGFLSKIMSARKGEDVRSSIHDSIEAINEEAERLTELCDIAADTDVAQMLTDVFDE